MYGTVLSSTQLNASADMIGCFDYNLAAYTVLYTDADLALSTTFTPTDTTNNKIDGAGEPVISA